MGGLVEGTIEKSYVKGGNVKGVDGVGGLVGYAESSTVEDSYALEMNSVSGSQMVGVLVG